MTITDQEQLCVTGSPVALDRSLEAFRIKTHFYKADGSQLTFYMAHPVGCPEGWIYSDACQFLKDSVAADVMLKPSMLQSLAATYGIKLTAEMNLFDDEIKGDMEEREYRFTQCLIALDGILRMWGTQSPLQTAPGMENQDG